MKLTEGLIKLPQGLLAEMTEFMLVWYFAYVKGEIAKRFRFDEDDLTRAERFLAMSMKEHNIDSSKVTKAHVKTVSEKKNFLRLFKLHETSYGEELDFKVRFRFLLERHSPLKGNIGLYQDSSAFITLSAFNLHMTGASLGTLSALRHSLNKISDMIGYLEHELTHLIQYRALSVKHGDQVSGDYGEVDEFTDVYGLSQVEFDPLIKSDIKVLKRLVLKYKSYPGYNERELVDAYIFAAKPPAYMHPSDRSQLFDVLKRRAPVKWAKAVKLFTTAYWPHK